MVTNLVTNLSQKTLGVLPQQLTVLMNTSKAKSYLTNERGIVGPTHRLSYQPDKYISLRAFSAQAVTLQQLN